MIVLFRASKVRRILRLVDWWLFQSVSDWESTSNLVNELYFKDVDAPGKPFLEISHLWENERYK